MSGGSSSSNSDPSKVVFKFDESSESSLRILKGLVVSSGSSVTVGLENLWRPWPSADASTALCKQLFGIRKKKAVQEDDDEPKLVAAMPSDLSDSDSSYESESESEDSSDAEDSDDS